MAGKEAFSAGAKPASSKRNLSRISANVGNEISSAGDDRPLEDNFILLVG